MARSDPDAAAWDVVVDSCSVRAKRGGDLTGPNPTDRGKSGTKYHVVVSTDSLPLAVLPSPANVYDTKLFPALLRLTQVVCTAIGRLYADAGYDSAVNRWLCLRDGVQPHIRKIGEPHRRTPGTDRPILDPVDDPRHQLRNCRSHTRLSVPKAQETDSRPAGFRRGDHRMKVPETAS
ncbi:transposase [Azospirillum sp.]|uniref:transposase n=1 Tax=Azospirillum sp. TaxID=34012 RepID=UPI0039C8730C